ncbi:MAG: helix-hairpin-helix domain-containing protein [Anaerolineae bacterium]|jgi:predicted flap endonuclease-1-like 5' DNA nuclease
MSVTTALIVGLLAGWLIEWVIDWVYWRDKTGGVDVSMVEQRAKELEGQLKSAKAEAADAAAELKAVLEREAKLQAAKSALEDRVAELESIETAAARRETAKKAAAVGAAAGAAAGAEAQRQVDRADELKAIYGINQAVEKKLHDAKIRTYAQLAALGVARYQAIAGADVSEDVDPERVLFIARVTADSVENPQGDDLEAINGIGPVINGLLHDAGISTYADLGRLSQEAFEEILGEQTKNIVDEADIIAQARRLAVAK